MFILRLLNRLWRQAGVWRRGRSWRYFLQGLPALLAGVALLTISLAAAFTPAQELEARYLEQAKNSMKAKDYSGAKTCYDRLAYLAGPNRPDILYGLAVCEDGFGQATLTAAQTTPDPAKSSALREEGLRCLASAEVIMKGLTPPDQPGYARAHFWLANRILSTPAGPEARQAAESHLLRALDGELDDREAARALLGELYLEARPPRFDDAEAQLSQAVKAKPQIRIRLAQLYALRGDKERARSEAQLAVGYYRSRTASDLNDRRARLGWADATAFLEDFPGAVSILQEGLKVSDDPVYRDRSGGRLPRVGGRRGP